MGLVPVAGDLYRQIAEGKAHAGTAKANRLAVAVGRPCPRRFMGGVLAGMLGNKRSWCLLCIATWVSVMALFGLTTQFRHEGGIMAMVAGLFVTAGISAGCRNISRSFPDAHPRHGPGLRLQHRPHPHGLSACSAWACWRSSSRATTAAPR